MFSQVTSWFKSHATAILTTAIAVSKAGLLGKVGAAIVSAIALACGAAT